MGNCTLSHHLSAFCMLSGWVKTKCVNAAGCVWMSQTALGKPGVNPRQNSRSSCCWLTALTDMCDKPLSLRPFLVSDRYGSWYGMPGNINIYKPLNAAWLYNRPTEPHSHSQQTAFLWRCNHISEWIQCTHPCCCPTDYWARPHRESKVSRLWCGCEKTSKNNVRKEI